VVLPGSGGADHVVAHLVWFVWYALVLHRFRGIGAVGGQSRDWHTGG
jgi:hypothetical protein